MSLEVAISYAEQIRQRHEAARKAGDEVGQAMLRQIQITRECGQLIADARGDLRDEEFAQAISFLDERAVKSYLKFARDHSEPINDLENAVIAIRSALQPSGVLEFPDGHGRQELHDPNFFSTAAKQLMSFLSSFRRFVRATPIATWDRDTAEMFLYSLKPILEIHAELKRHVYGK